MQSHEKYLKHLRKHYENKKAENGKEKVDNNEICAI